MRSKREGARASGAAHGISRRDFLRAGATVGAVAVAAAGSKAAEGPPADSGWAQTSDKVIRMGVVGGGFGLAWHWHEHPNCKVEAVSDLDPERRKQLAGKYQAAKTCGSLEQLILDPNVDAVALFTGAPDHPGHVIACMNHGKHVISACPACMTLEQAAEMKEVKERTGLKYMTAETSYCRWETITARRLIQDGSIGDLVYTEAEYYHPLTDGEREQLWFRNGHRTWRYGYPPMLYPTHSTAFLVGVTGERLVKVSCIGTCNMNEAGYKDNVYNNPFSNAVGLFITDKGHPFRCNVAKDFHAHGERAQWFGTKGALYMANSGGQPSVLMLGDKALPAAGDYWHMVPPKMRYDSGHGASHPFLTNEFIMALVEDREPATNLYEALAFCVPGIVAHQSALKGGEQLTIPSFDRA